MSGKSKITKDFDEILKDNGRTTKQINVKSNGSNINLHSLIIKLLNTEKTVPKKNYRFNEAFNIFDEKDNKGNKLQSIKLGLLIRLIQEMQCQSGNYGIQIN